MRNRPIVLTCALLGMAPGLVFPPLLAGQYQSRLLSNLAAAHAAVPFLVQPGRSVSAEFRPATPASPAVVRWYHGLLFMGAVAALSPLDEPVRDGWQDVRSTSSNDVAKVIRHVGQPEVYATVALGTVAAGLISGNSKITRAGARISSGIALGGAVATMIKLGLGRRRPFSAEDQYTFGPFSKADASFPSGHTMTAFALATGVSDEVHSLPVTIGMYTLATGVGWSRMNDNKHWLTDVVAGAGIGIASVKLMNGRWRVFGISAPHVLLEPGQAGVAWSGTF
jgi:membrane-associated phospholipid phosphatase